MSDSEAARAAIGALPPNPPQPVESQEAGQQTPEVAQAKGSTESSTAPAGFGSVGNLGAVAGTASDVGASLGAVDPLAFIGSIKTLVDLGTKVLGLVAKFPGPQQAAAQEALKVLNMLDGILGHL